VVAETKGGKRVLVVQVMGRLFMEPLDDPFASVESALANHRLGAGLDAIVVDIHAEATSEKTAMGVYLDGRVSMVVGSHSHIPTADARVLPGGTAYQTDAGMCGDYNSVIGMKKEAAVARFVRKMPGEKLEPAEGEGTVCAVLVETDDLSGLATACRPLRIGGELIASL
jgi:calcineurin-like phosphoesterase